MHHKLIFSSALTALLISVGCTEKTVDETTPSDGGSTANTGGSTASTGGGGSEETGGGGEGGTPEVEETGWLFTMSNATEGNELIVFERAPDGALTQRADVPTGGLGSGNGLGSQGALTISPSGEYLYVVNAGSHQLSSFRIYDDHISLVDLVASGGERPVSVTASDDLVYVVNADGDGGVQGFSVSDGILTPIAAQPLSGVGTGPGQIGLNPDGDALIVTEKGANNLLTYWVAPDGSLSAPTVTASSGMTPFGFDWTSDGRLLVAEAFGGNPGEAAVSSYALTGVEPEVISASVQNGQTAACWIVAARDAFAYTTNTPSDNISGYGIAADGSLNLFDDGGVTADMGPDQRPLDAALSSDHDYLYVLNNMSDLVVGFTIADDGSLSALSDSLSVPATSVGLAAR